VVKNTTNFTTCGEKHHMCFSQWHVDCKLMDLQGNLFVGGLGEVLRLELGSERSQRGF